MKARSRAGTTWKSRRRKAAKSPRRDAPKPASASASTEGEIARLTRELTEALEQQAATLEVLNAISRSTFDLRTVLTPLWKPRRASAKQTRCKSCFPATIQIGSIPPGASAIPPNIMNISKPSRLHRGGRVSLDAFWRERKPVYIVDALADPEYSLREVQRLGGFRTHLGLPLLREDNVIGVLLVSRPVVEPFDNKHIELLGTFAAQAVIAIENARLLNELRQRTSDLTEALEQQRATSNLLQVISGSLGNLEPVFQAMLDHAVTICGANFGNMFLYENDAFPSRCTTRRKRTPRLARAGHFVRRLRAASLASP